MAIYTLQADLKAGRFLLLNDSHSYVISEILYDILNKHKEYQDMQKITDFLLEKYNNPELNAEFVTRALDLAFQKLSDQDNTGTSADFLHAKITIIKENTFDWFYSSLSFLFRKIVFIPGMTVGILITCYFFYYNDILSLSAIYDASLQSLTPFNLILSYFLFLLVILLHEIGHATATTYFKLKPKEIGFGFYFIFPVFYTNVSSIWRLDSGKRNIVNIGGIYFQLLLNILLICFFFYSNSAGPVFSLIIANTISIFVSLNPFFRYDGYWILSDTFNLSNLTNKARLLVVEFMKNPVQCMSSIKGKNLHMLNYGFLKIIFWLYIYYTIGNFLVLASNKVYNFYQEAFWTKGQLVIIDFLITGTTIIFVIIFLVVHFNDLMKFLLKYVFVKRNIISPLNS